MVFDVFGSTSVFGINDARTTVGLTGVYSGDLVGAGFVRSNKGDAATLPGTVVGAINNRGDAVMLKDVSGVLSAYVRDPKGRLQPIPLNGEALVQFTPPFVSINEARMVVGAYGAFPNTHGFVFVP